MSSRISVPRPGHRVRLLEGSGELFPALVAAVDAAVRDVRLETYIFDVTGKSVAVAEALERAARRGVRVRLVIDGFGSESLPPEWRERFASAGVECLTYAPLRRFGLLRPGSWRRLHRKLCVVDGEMAFCGGINILDDLYDPNHGTLESPRFDFAVEVTGPLVAEAEAAMARLWLRMQALQDVKQARLAGALGSLRAYTGVRHRPAAPASDAPRARAMLVLRDNLRTRTSIERAYRRAIGRAREEIIIANAYFVPGGRMRRALVNAARRGVRVSLLLAREANVVVDDARFAQRLRDRLLHAMLEEGDRMDRAAFEKRPPLQRAKERLALILMRILLVIQGKKYL